MQDLFLSGLIGEAACIIINQLDITQIEALERFYQSRTCAPLHISGIQPDLETLSAQIIPQP